MADLILQPPTIPSVPLNAILSPSSRRHNGSSKSSLRHSKSTPQLRSGYGLSVTGALTHTFKTAGDIWLSLRDGMTAEQREAQRLKDEKRQILCLRMKGAETHAQWEAAAKDLDALDGNDDWKQEDSSPDYNAELIAQRLRELDVARASCDIGSMMHLIRTALLRDLGGMDNVSLYRHSYTGTKRLIERYVESAVATIDAVVTQSRHDPSVQYTDLLEGMLYSRQSFGRSALLLSGGGTLGMSHIGVLKTLFEAKLLPRIISGASAGSIVCSVLCTRTDEEMPEMMDTFPYGDLAVFEEQNSQDGVLQNLRRLLTEGSWSDIKHLTRVMRELTGDLTFQEAYNRTRRILNICVSTASVYELPRLLNYVTAPNVLIWSAVATSCSVPVLFNSSQILVKDPITGEHQPWNPSPQRWIDGSVDNDLPMTRLAEMFNVNHFIVSQVNPHVVPFLAKDDHLSPDLMPGERPKAPTNSDDFDWISTFTALAKDEALHRLHFLSELGIFPNLVTKFRSILSQKYSGDITILPQLNLQDVPKILQNPTPDFMLRSALAGARATWPKLSRIRDRCAIELALDNAAHRLRARVVFAESQTDLRRLRFSSGNLRTQHALSMEKPLGTPHAGHDNGGPRRHRRRSGGSLQVPRIRRSALAPGLDSDEKQEENLSNLESTMVASSPSILEKPTLKRASRSQIQVSQRRPLMGPIDTEPEFVLPHPYSQLGLGRSISIGGSPFILPDEDSQPPSMFHSWQPLDFSAAEDDVDTDDHGPSSDTGEHGHEDSETELEGGDQSVTSPEPAAKPTDDLEASVSSTGIDDVAEGHWD
ncbi:unnamed protein product [Clonostachys byssicola]|uniref:Patatin-like phospholipase domain-containing protein n=1 Tax=Clonostachys byssicola TaxID=160290 RepID=A0A9N9YBV6_9HYPO|nr:unnamed protein product [Clonostachys byssicola]